MRFKYLILVVLLIGLVSAQGNVTNLVVSQVLSDFVAGEMVSTIFSFDYPDLSLNYSEQVEGMPLVFVVNISSNDSNYPVWKGDFVLNGTLNSFDNFASTDYEFDCFEDSFSVNCPYCPFDILDIPNGTFYCSDVDFFRLGLGSENEVTLNVLSDVALWPGSYNFSVGLFYPERNWTKLFVEPILPDGLNGWYVSEPEFSLVNSEAVEIYYRWDSGGIYSYSLPFGLENITNLPVESAGTLELNWWADLDCENESELTRVFYVDLVNPVVEDLMPEDESVVYSLRPEIGAYLSEVHQSNSGINLSSVIVKVDGDVVDADVVGADSIDAVVSYLPLSDLSVGEHRVFVYVEDNAGRASSVSWGFEVSGESLSLNVFSPLGGNYDNKRIAFNLTTSREVEEIEWINWDDNNPRWRRLCRDCEEYGFDRVRKKRLREGENNISFRAEGEEVNVSVFIDSKDPRISKTLPKRNKYTNGSDFYLKYTEDNTVNISVSWNPTVNLSLENCSASGRYEECYFDLNLSEFDGEEITYSFEVKDVVGAIGSSRLTKVKVDTSKPKLLNNETYWWQGEDRYAKYVYFNMSIEEENLDEVVYIYRDSRDRVKEKRLCSRLRDGICEKRKRFRDGEELLGVRIVDKAGNEIYRDINFEIRY